MWKGEISKKEDHLEHLERCSGSNARSRLRNLSILAFLWPDLGFVPELGMSFSRQQNGHLYDIYLYLMLIAWEWKIISYFHHINHQCWNKSDRTIQHVREILFGFPSKLKENFTYFIGFRQCNKLYALNYMVVSLYANSGDFARFIARISSNAAKTR